MILISFKPLNGAKRKKLKALPSPGTPHTLRSAVNDLIRTFHRDYSRGKNYLILLSGLEEKVEQGKISKNAFQKKFKQLQYDALTDNPLIKSNPILFVTRPQYVKDHHNTATIFQNGEINKKSFKGPGALKVLDLSRDKKIITLLEAPKGIIRDPDISFSGKKILFSFRKNIKDDYHIYEIDAEGKDLRQLTRAGGVSDIDPIYLPDNSIAFSSTREPKYCMCNRHIMANIFKMNGNGANIHQIGKSTLFEGHLSLMPDGRILYYRWEYIDRNFGDAQGLWTINPDGSQPNVYYGNNTWSPGGVIDARIIPNTDKAVCIFTSCHDRPWGALTIIDRNMGIDGKGPVIRTWPGNAIDLVKNPVNPKKYGYDRFLKVSPKYEDPFPLVGADNKGAGKYFLCSRQIRSYRSKSKRDEKMGIYLIDLFGNEILLHYEEPGCYDPMPIISRKKPLDILSRKNFKKKYGAFYIQDVYEGSYLSTVKRGDIKFLRVIESPEKRNFVQPGWEGQGQEAPAMNWHDFNNKRILGTVNVEDDGSVYFKVPSEKFIYFQLLDKNGMMIQSMRSGTGVQPGEISGCIGCHENRHSAPLIKGKTRLKALSGEPKELDEWYGPARFFNYMNEVQPVFDKNCISCHDYNKPAGKKLNLSGDRSLVFNTSYNELWRKKYIKAIGAGPFEVQTAYSWGSHASRLIKILQAGHHNVKLGKESFNRLVTWIDINGPYYPVYESAFPLNSAGRSPLNSQQIKQLSELTGIKFNKLTTHAKNKGPQISFNRPELSPCLTKIKNKNDYLTALSIIKEGNKILQKTPRADMNNFTACDKNRARLDKYDNRMKKEERSRRAILQNTEVFDQR